MPSIEIFIAFLIATSVFAYMPGPSMLYTAAQTIARGRKAGWLAVTGIHIGGYVHVAAAALGLAILFEAVPFLYMALKFAGALYLIWLGIKLFRSQQSFGIDTVTADSKGPKRAFWESVIVEILNPKTAIFYVAFLPQFTNPMASLPMWAQLFILGTVVNVMFTSADVFCVLLADKVTTFLKRSQKAGRWVQRIGGGTLITLGLNVAFNRQ
ncbi:LysE family translocator [Curvivirga sp.]|uniref:LysE family translocator n=1 Tax=Curvivirga sp. TaxID=2856848 RepID=UPI003B5D02B2